MIVIEPPEAVTEIVPGLYLGAHDAFVHIPTTDLHIACAFEDPPHYLSARKVVHLPLHDDDQVPWMSIPGWVDSIVNAASLTARTVHKQERALITCHMGINRSGLICGLALCMLGYEAEDAIELMRSLRSPSVLCNSVFEDVVLELGG